MDLELREHQMHVVNALRDGFKQGHRSQLLYAPTGFGKTEVAIYLMKATKDNYKRAAMVLDRIVLVDQTSNRLTKYGISHGVFQADHWRFDRTNRLQVCSAQTLERRQDFPEIDLLIVDECHITREQTSEFIKNNPNVKVIGLTATPFTKGLGDLYSNVVCGATTEDLVNNKWLAPLKVYIAKEIDMTGAKKVAGEWSQDVATERSMKITGDIVSEWIKKTHEVFGKPVKTIVFCSGVAHGANLVDIFAQNGYNFVSISYKDNDEFKRQAIEDFAKPDTEINGLIATDILTRGFDVSDVMIGVSARPFSKSLSSHIQQMGRVMRPHDGKEYALWLDHSGNYLRFRDDWDEIYSDGVKTLNSKVERAKKELTEKKKAESKCPSCGYLWPKNSDTCPACGYVRKRKSMVDHVAGELVELVAGNKAKKDDKQIFYSELLYIAKQRKYNPNWASHIYRDKFGVWPRGLLDTEIPPSINTMKWITHKQILWARKRDTA
jgi:DNA repair protein RadD